MTIPKFSAWRLIGAGVVVAGLSACGGGSGIEGGSISTISATSINYARNMTVAVSGQQLADTNYIKAEGCENARASTGGTAASRSYVCTIKKVGPMIVRVHNKEGDVLGSVRVEVPMPQVRFTTGTGPIIVELDPTKAPATVDNFLAYAGTSSNTSFYTNMIFHRVIKDFVIQAGGYNKNLVVKNPTRAAIALESQNGLKNLRGTIAMARTGEPNSATSQFFINVKDNPDLDYKSADEPGYAVFGKVVEGQNVVDAIQEVATTTKNDSTGRPLENVPVTEIVITAAQQIR
jgi:peptidyl-prolyl cis-trans isomerase A (cyclophilin A)